MKMSHLTTHAVPKETSCQTTAPVSSLLWIVSTVAQATKHTALFYAVKETKTMSLFSLSCFYLLPFSRKKKRYCQFNATAPMSINYISSLWPHLWQLYRDHTWYQRRTNQPTVTRIIPLILLYAEAL